MTSASSISRAARLWTWLLGGSIFLSVVAVSLLKGRLGQPGPDGELDTADDIRTVDDLHIEVGKTYHFELQSTDVMHSFSVPVFRLKQDAVPGRTINGWFKATKTGEFDIQCAEMCGIGHGIMAGRIHIESAEDHQKWMASKASDNLASAQ